MRDEDETLGPAGMALTETRRRAIQALAYRYAHSTPIIAVTEEDHRQTRRDLRVAIIFGIVAASLELGVLIYFFRP